MTNVLFFFCMAARGAAVADGAQMAIFPSWSDADERKTPAYESVTGSRTLLLIIATANPSPFSFRTAPQLDRRSVFLLLLPCSGRLELQSIEEETANWKQNRAESCGGVGRPVNQGSTLSRYSHTEWATYKTTTKLQWKSSTGKRVDFR
jgi:hypothetical protein